MKRLLISAVAAICLMLVPKTKIQAGNIFYQSRTVDSIPPMTKDTSTKKWEKEIKSNDTTIMKSKRDSTNRK